MPPKKQKVLELDDEPRVKQEPGVEQQQQQKQPARETQGVVRGDSVVEALVVSNSRLCAQVAACDARAFTEWERASVLEERARVLEEQLTEGKVRNSVLEAEGRAKDAEIARLQSEATRQQQQQQQQLLDLVARLVAQPAAARAAGGAAVPAPAPTPAPAPLLSQQQQAQACADEAERLLAAGQFAAAAQQLQRAIGHGHLPSRALKAWMLLDGREGVARDWNAAFELVEEGARLGCHHCQGVMADCYRNGNGCVADKARSLELARESSGKGSRYGQYVLGCLYDDGEEDVATDEDFARAVPLYRLAAAQNLDGAQNSLGIMYEVGLGGVAQDLAEALRLYQLAAAQGHPEALCHVAAFHERGPRRST